LFTFCEKIDIGKKISSLPLPPGFLGTPGGRHNDVTDSVSVKMAAENIALVSS
jgi:hypothetical protein